MRLEPDYATVGHALIDTLRRGLGAEFAREVESAWLAAYTVLADTMIEASEGLQTAYLLPACGEKVPEEQMRGHPSPDAELNEWSTQLPSVV